MAFNQNVELVGPYQSSAPGAAGSSSYAFTAPVAGVYSLDWKIMLPTPVGGGGLSGIIVTITNATGPVTIFSSTPGAQGGKVDTLAAANDVITFSMSSTAAADFTTLNNVKATIAISSGV